ncbi:MAG TPA: hypothetical protein VLB84_19705 [Bacteroidia bacterium]|nr:hypothetical protein [Bacteroidia bacterium]
MNIYPQLIEAYFEKANYPVHVGFKIDPVKDSDLSITKGRLEENGSLTVFLSYHDINDILEINDILGETGKLIVERDKSTTDYKKKNQLMKDLVYLTLQKYIYQMLNAAQNQNFYPELKHLDKHKGYWPR